MSKEGNISRTKLIGQIWKNSLILILHFVVLALSVILLVALSIDTFHNINFSYEPRFLKLEYWVCVAFLADFFIEIILSRHKWKYLRSRFFFFLVSIPYVAIIHQTGWHFSAQIEYLLRFVPLVRGGYALAVVINWFTYNRATGLLLTYLTTLAATVYFVSLTFFVFEHGVNPGVKTYSDALWWACMNVTTIGSSIIAHTPVGRVLGVLLGALGMMIFPVFTVYVISLIKRQRQADDKVSMAQLIKAVRELHRGNGDTPPTETSSMTNTPKDSQQ